MNTTNIVFFLKDNKTNILLAALCILMAWLIINWFRYLINNYFIGTEGFEQNKYSSSTYDNPNTPLTTHSVDLPLNTNFTCSNFCGPKARCSKSGQQCSTDVDCYSDGCQTLLKLPTKKQIQGVEDTSVPYDAAGRLTYNQTPQYSSLTNDIVNNAGIINKDAEISRPYDGIKIWEETYDAQAQMIDDELAYIYSAEPEKYKSTPHYKQTRSVTGLFYDIGPTPANAYLS